MRRFFRPGVLVCLLSASILPALSVADAGGVAPVQERDRAVRPGPDRPPVRPDAGRGATDSLGPLIALVPAEPRIAVGDRLRLQVVVAGVRDLVSAPLTLGYDPEILELESTELGPGWPGPVKPTLLSHSPDPGKLIVGLAGLGPSREGLTGSGRILELTFTALRPGTTRVEFQRHALLAPGLSDLGGRSRPATVTVER